MWVDVGMEIDRQGGLGAYCHIRSSTKCRISYNLESRWTIGLGPSRAISGDWQIPKGQTENNKASVGCLYRRIG